MPSIERPTYDAICTFYRYNPSTIRIKRPIACQYDRFHTCRETAIGKIEGYINCGHKNCKGTHQEEHHIKSKLIDLKGNY